MCIAIQRYLNKNGKPWKLVDGPDFVDLRIVLDNVMKDRTSRNIGMVVRQAEVITPNIEEKLWKASILGEDTPEVYCSVYARITLFT